MVDAFYYLEIVRTKPKDVVARLDLDKTVKLTFFSNVEFKIDFQVQPFPKFSKQRNIIFASVKIIFPFPNKTFSNEL